MEVNATSAGRYTGGARDWTQAGGRVRMALLAAVACGMAVKIVVQTITLKQQNTCRMDHRTRTARVRVRVRVRIHRVFDTGKK